MTPDELSKKMSELSEDLKHDCAEIIAETATEYFKGTFKNKAFDGRPWKRTAKKTGSTLIESGNLMNSIRPSEVSESRVVISAGNDKVPYARVHNEGGIQDVRPHTRTRKGAGGTTRYQVRSYSYHAWKRQFMGYSKELMDIIDKRITNYLNEILQS